MYKHVVGSEAMGYLATRPTVVITTLHESDIVNAGVFGAYTKLSSTHLGVAVGVGSHTYGNIIRSGEFVVNIPGADIVKTMKILAAKIPADKSELDEAGLNAKEGVNVKTPSVAECAAAVEFVFEQEIAFGVHNFMVGKVKGGWIKDEALDTDGKIDIFKAKIFKDFKYPKDIYVMPGKTIDG